MNRPPRPWLSAVLLAVLVFLPLSASAGMTPKEVNAFQGYKAEAEKGNRGAQFILGLCYAAGEGVAKNQVEAYAYLSLAGIEYEPARKDLAILENRMSPDARLRGQQRTKELQKEIEAKQAGK